MAMKHEEATALVRAIVGAFARSGEGYVSAQPITADHHEVTVDYTGDLIVKVHVAPGDQRASQGHITFYLHESASLDTVRAIVRSIRQAWIKGMHDGTELAVLRAQQNMKLMLTKDLATEQVRYG